MDFGLWFEPEMINLDSDLARAHPEWIFRAGGREGIPTRNQYVLDLGQPGCVRLHRHPDPRHPGPLRHRLPQVGPQPDGGRGRSRRARASPACTPTPWRSTDCSTNCASGIPGLEIESCAGGGGRIDLGILERTDRVWASDCIDALERQQIQRYTQLLLPPELIGSHVGAHEAHTTKRMHNLDFRAGTAFWGHMGIEWDLTKAIPGRTRPVAAMGRALPGSTATCCTPAMWWSPIIRTRRSGCTAWSRRIGATRSSESRRSTAPPRGHPAGCGCPVCEPDRRYRLTPLPPADRYPGATQFPGWWDDGVTLSGRAAGRRRGADPGHVPGVPAPDSGHRAEPDQPVISCVTTHQGCSNQRVGLSRPIRHSSATDPADFHAPR